MNSSTGYFERLKTFFGFNQMSGFENFKKHLKVCETGDL